MLGKLNTLKTEYSKYIKRSTRLSDKTIKSKLLAIDEFIMFVGIYEIVHKNPISEEFKKD